MPDETDARRHLFDRFRTDFLGLDRTDPVHTAGGLAERRRVYLDTTATALMPGVVWRGLQAYLERACANSHTDAHRAGRDTTAAIEDSRHSVGRLVGYDPVRDVVLFTANGATGAINFLARALFPPELRSLIKRFPDGAPAPLVRTLSDALGDHGAAAIADLLDRPLVVTTRMEHHSNLLPWIEAVGHHNVRAVDVAPGDGTLRLDHLRRILDEEGDRVRCVAVAGVSNVTGIVNPVHAIARMAHAAGADIVVDGAQWVPHAPVRMHPGDPSEDLDYLVLSGHKMYAPGSRGALVGRLSTLESRACVTDVGGGMVEYVTIEDFAIKDEVTAREEAGTPNIPGSIAMGLVSEALMAIGMDVVAEAEEALARRLVARLAAIEGLHVYGSTDLDRVPRAGVVSFDVVGAPHGLVAAYLNDFHNIAVRDGCFCAHPYITQLLHIADAAQVRLREELGRGDRRHIPGMVRASLGVYSVPEDVEALGEALEALIGDLADIKARYEPELDGTWRLRDRAPLPTAFHIATEVAAWAGEVG